VVPRYFEEIIIYSQILKINSNDFKVFHKHNTIIYQIILFLFVHRDFMNFIVWNSMNFDSDLLRI
jgi:hypothetical protein